MAKDKSVDPNWPTTMRSRLPDGRCMGTDGSVWLYRAVPMAPVVDAVSPEAGLAASEPMMSAFDELAAITPVRMARRSTAKSAYRQFHILMVNVPKAFVPPPGHPLAGYLAAAFPDDQTDRRLLLFGVRLKDRVGGGSGGLTSVVSSVAETLATGTTPLSDFDKDFADIDAALARSGLALPLADDFRLANAWWNHGTFPDTPLLIHGDHLHVFGSADSARAAARLGEGNCDDWPPMPAHHALAFGCVQEFDLPFVNASSVLAQWVPVLVDAGACVVNIRGLVEPPKVTRAELRRRRKQYTDDVRERAAAGKMDRIEQEEKLSELTEVEGVYANGGPPTLIDCSTLVVFSGRDERNGYDVTDIGRDSGVVLNSMVARQDSAMAETFLCSPVRANPHLQDLPAQTIACSGLPSLSLAGDETGAMLGFTERDRQPSYISPTAAADEDSVPVMVVAGQSGSGKQLSLDTRVMTPEGFTTMEAIRVGDRVYGRDGSECAVTFVTDVDPSPEMFELVLSDGQRIKADKDHQWVVSTLKDRNYHKHPSRLQAIESWESSRRVIHSLRELARTEDDDSSTVSLAQLTKLVTDRVPGVPWATRIGVYRALDFVDCPYNTVTGGPGLPKRLYNTEVALKALAARVDQMFGDRPMVDRGERRITTGEMLAEGVSTPFGSQFAIHASCLEGRDVELPLDPYILGVWLGDGTAAGGSIASATAALCTGPDGVTDQAHMLRFLAEFRARPMPAKRDTVIATYGLTSVLRRMGVLNNKHIPTLYLRASHAQRLRLLQGLMDTDGGVIASGCKIGMSDRRLVHDVGELVRSLGITTRTNTYPNYGPPRRDPLTGQLVRLRVKDMTIVYFKTSEPVFRLPRKAEAQDRQMGERSKWLFIKAINPIPSEPARCIQVDSPDHTYLIENNVVTSNTVTLLYLADQFARVRNAKGERTPVIIIDPKQGSDHSYAVENSGGQVASLDDLASADGVFDPMRFAARREVGVELASTMLLSINPWGAQKLNYETPLTTALSYGAQHGADCIGQALLIAEKAGQAPKDMVDKVLSLAQHSAMFGACVGVHPGTTGLRMSEGITLIKVGDAYLDLPEPGAMADASQQQRIALALVRMMVFGSAMALTGRQGVIMLDEAWVFLGAGRSEMERLGRLARSQQVFPMLFTQRVRDATRAGMAGYISRGLILPIQDEDEAHAACDLFKLEATPERMGRLTARDSIGGTAAGVGGSPNWNSMRALRDRTTGEVLRGAVGIYVDLAGRAVPVEVKIPPEFFVRASTNPEDIRRRQAARDLRDEDTTVVEAPPDSLGEWATEPAEVPAGRPRRQEAVDPWQGAKW